MTSHPRNMAQKADFLNHAFPASARFNTGPSFSAKSILSLKDKIFSTASRTLDEIVETIHDNHDLLPLIDLKQIFYLIATELDKVIEEERTHILPADSKDALRAVYAAMQELNEVVTRNTIRIFGLLDPDRILEYLEKVLESLAGANRETKGDIVQLISRPERTTFLRVLESEVITAYRRQREEHKEAGKLHALELNGGNHEIELKEHYPSFSAPVKQELEPEGVDFTAASHNLNNPSMPGDAEVVDLTNDTDSDGTLEILENRRSPVQISVVEMIDLTDDSILVCTETLKLREVRDLGGTDC